MHVHSMVTRADTNGNGTIDEDEFCQLIASLRRRMAELGAKDGARKTAATRPADSRTLMQSWGGDGGQRNGGRPRPSARSSPATPYAPSLRSALELATCHCGYDDEDPELEAAAAPRAPLCRRRSDEGRTISAPSSSAPCPAILRATRHRRASTTAARRVGSAAVWPSPRVGLARERAACRRTRPRTSRAPRTSARASGAAAQPSSPSAGAARRGNRAARGPCEPPPPSPAPLSAPRSTMIGTCASRAAGRTRRKKKKKNAKTAVKAQ